MHEFRYKNNQLYCEGLNIAEITRKVGTPFYLYSHKTLIDHYRKLKTAFEKVNPLICFSMKSNSSLAVCKALVREGAGLDVVSGGELYKALKVGVNPKKIVYASVGKTEREIAQAIRVGILFFNVESLPELELINRVARSLKKKVKVSLRLNPDVAAKTHKFITTGKKENKFGLDFTTAFNLFLDHRWFSHLDMAGIHIHIGSQITESAPFVAALKKTVTFIGRLKRRGVKIRYLNIGGGLGIVYSKEAPQTAKDFAKAILPIIGRKGLKVILEPGRFIAGNSGILVTKVLYVKETQSKRFIIVDAAMNDLLRPALYHAHHEVLPVRSSWFLATGAWGKADVVGPVCESGDFLAKDRKMPPVEEGELLAVMGAGAYGFTMSSNYNSRPRVAEAMVIRNKLYIVRDRESYKDLIEHERIPKILK